MTASQAVSLVGLILLAPVCTWGANPERGDRIVQEVLAREATADVPDRATLLRGVVSQSPKLSAAHWASGEVAIDSGWRSVADQTQELSADAMLSEYRSLRDASDLTLARHWELAQWCEQHGLRDQERAHLWALLAENGQPPELWKRLGYHLVDGQWLTAEEERDLERQWQQRQRDLKRWLPKAENFARRLTDPNPMIQAPAREQLRNLDDIAALPAMETTFCTQTPELALEFLTWAKGIDRVETTLALARQAIASPYEGVRNIATTWLTSRRMADFVPALLGVMIDANTHAAVGGGFKIVGITKNKNPIVTTLPREIVFRRELQDRVLVYRYLQYDGPASQFAIARREAASQRRNPINRSSAGQVVLRLQTERLLEDEARVAQQTQEQVAITIAELEETISTQNQQIVSVLKATTGETSLESSKDWWAWWANYASLEATHAKPTFTTTQTSGTEVTEIVRLPGNPPSCLPAGTPVYTELGPKPIETIRIGDRVLAKDVETGEIAFRPVLKTTVRSPQPLVKLGLRSETIPATRGHHFWVSGQGWRMAREIQPGDRLHGLTGTVSVTDVTDGESAAVYNLVVDRAHTYFVGTSLILSHDVTSPAPTNVKVPGLAIQ